MTPRANARLIAPLLKAAAGNHLGLNRLLSDLGYQDGLAGLETSGLIPLSDYYRMQRDVAKALDDITVSLSERKLTYRTGDFVVEQLARARTLVEAIEGLADHFNMMHGGAYNSVRVSGSRVTLVIDDSSFPYTPNIRHDRQLAHFIGDTVLIQVHCLLDSLSQGRAADALRRVGMVRARNEPENDHTRFWSVPVLWSRTAYELVYDYDVASRQLPDPPGLNLDLSLSSIFARVIDRLEDGAGQAGRRSYTEQTRALISDGLTLQCDVASKLGVSVATLRRRLADEGAGFRDLINASRVDQATARLSRGERIPQVAEALGYSDIRAFNRAFKRHEGMTPAAYQRRNPSKMSEIVHSR